MPRPVPAALLLLALVTAPALAGCGGDDEPAATGPPTTPSTATAPATSAPTTTAPVPTSPASGSPDADDDAPQDEGTETLAAPGSDPPPRQPTVTDVQRPSAAVRCPGGSGKGAVQGDFDAREMLGLSTARATALAERNDCVLRVVVRDGQELIRTMDFSSSRVNVTETKGRIVAINGIG